MRWMSQVQSGASAERTVRAARLVGHGLPLVVQRVPLAEPGPDDVVVNMSFAGVNPVDRYAAAGTVAPDGPLPRTLGREGVGVADGRPVVVYGHGLGTARDGVWADAAVVPRAACLDLPDGVPAREAAALGVAGATAYRTVTELARVTPDDHVLVLGASGGVGSMILSLVHSIGALVWGQTGQEEKARAIGKLGADHVVVGPADALTGAIAELRPTVVFDPLGGAFTGAAVEAMAPYGRLVLFGTSGGTEGNVPLRSLYRKGLSVLGYGGLIEPPDAIRRGIQGALEAVRAGKMVVEIDAVLPLEQVNEAFHRLEQRKVSGKVVLALGSQ
jgi:NADPH2:quinone reductase